MPSPGLSPLLTPASRRLHPAHMSDTFLRLTLSFTIKYQLNLDSILKSRDITLLAKVHSVKAMVFPVVMNGCENWTIKKAEHQRTNAFKLWCWRRFFTVPWTARRSNQSILKDINPEYSFKGLMLKLNKAPLFWPPDVKSQLTGKDVHTEKD